MCFITSVTVVVFPFCDVHGLSNEFIFRIPNLVGCIRLIVASHSHCEVIILNTGIQPKLEAEQNPFVKKSRQIDYEKVFYSIKSKGLTST